VYIVWLKSSKPWLESCPPWLKSLLSWYLWLHSLWSSMIYGDDFLTFEYFTLNLRTRKNRLKPYQKSRRAWLRRCNPWLGSCSPWFFSWSPCLLSCSPLLLSCPSWPQVHLHTVLYIAVGFTLRRLAHPSVQLHDKNGTTVNIHYCSFYIYTHHSAAIGGTKDGNHNRLKCFVDKMDENPIGTTRTFPVQLHEPG
jgi:hypothetical protein